MSANCHLEGRKGDSNIEPQPPLAFAGLQYETMGTVKLVWHLGSHHTPPVKCFVAEQGLDHVSIITILEGGGRVARTLNLGLPS